MFNIIMTLVIILSSMSFIIPKEDDWQYWPKGKCGYSTHFIYEYYSFYLSYYDSLELNNRFTKEELEDSLKELKQRLYKKTNKAVIDNIFYSSKWKKQMATSVENRYGFMADIKDIDDLNPAEIYCFSSKCDFVIFNFITPSSSFEMPAFTSDAAYVPRLDSVIFIDDLDTLDFQATFNIFVENSQDLRNIEPECISALILYLKYRKGTIYIVESAEDVLTARAINAARSDKNRMRKDYPPRFADTIFTKYELYFMDLAHTNEWFPDIKHYIREEKDFDDKYNDDNPFQHLDYHPVQIYSDESQTTVTLYVYVLWPGELAEWQIVLSHDNHIISMQYVKKPFWEYDRDSIFSPYIRDREVDSE